MLSFEEFAIMYDINGERLMRAREIDSGERPSDNSELVSIIFKELYGESYEG